ncbi:UNVERIFIED_CONTAM: hypothetical protein Cloal_1489 [Acetivibrio alkalicellulosi]
MDIFVERIVAKKKDFLDYFFIFAVFFSALFLFSIVLYLFSISSISMMLLLIISYLVYFVISLRKIEYEYAVTNGELDIDKIINQKKRKRMFSASCREFSVFSKLDLEKHKNEISEIPQKIKAVSSMNSQNVYFFTANYKGKKSVVFFEPDERMLNALKPYISKKIIKNWE